MGSANGDAGTATINPLTAFGDMGNLFNNLATTNKKPKWMIQTEIDAIVANKNKAGGESRRCDDGQTRTRIPKRACEQRRETGGQAASVDPKMPREQRR